MSRAPAGATETETTICSTTEHWPASAEGRPAAHPETDADYLWFRASTSAASTG